MGSLKHKAQHIVGPQLYFSSCFSPTHLPCSQGWKQSGYPWGRAAFPSGLVSGEYKLYDQGTHSEMEIFGQDFRALIKIIIPYRSRKFNTAHIEESTHQLAESNLTVQASTRPSTLPLDPELLRMPCAVGKWRSVMWQEGVPGKMCEERVAVPLLGHLCSVSVVKILLFHHVPPVWPWAGYLASLDWTFQLTQL